WASPLAMESLPTPGRPQRTTTCMPAKLVPPSKTKLTGPVEVCSSQGLGGTARPGNWPTLLVQKLPSVRSVEPTNPDRRDELRLEVAEVHAMPGSRLGRQGLPVSDTPTCFAADVAERPVAPDVLGRRL